MSESHSKSVIFTLITLANNLYGEDISLIIVYHIYMYVVHICGTVHYFSVTCVVHIHVLSAVSNVQLYALQKYEINVPIVEVYMYM